MIDLSRNDFVFVLTGAGISADSGIPTFRDEGGLWRNYRFEEVASPAAWQRDPQLVWEFYSMRRRVAAAAKPNPAHFALAALERSLGDRLYLCTQNVDGLHEQAGSVRVVHMHGELFKSRCDTCPEPPFHDTRTYEFTRRSEGELARHSEGEPARPSGEALGDLPRCHCGGRIRPHVCWFGEAPFCMDEIYQALGLCTVFIAIGTSGLVEPAASFAAHVHRRAHTRTIYVGPEPPANSHAFSQSFQGHAAVLPNLFALL
ncbi:MAG TPA: NAD-dependent deacylase [Candidatus Acidoferrales bacterium]|jgi:NAD-dependent deacetylase|nr:NAD-dependent deacylase [Candidatus Acidoferrales bacterium]